MNGCQRANFTEMFIKNFTNGKLQVQTDLQMKMSNSSDYLFRLDMLEKGSEKPYKICKLSAYRYINQDNIDYNKKQIH